MSGQTRLAGWWRIGAVAYPTIQVFVVLATGNHFLLDVLGGAACVLVAYGVALLAERLLRLPRPVASQPEEVSAG